MERTLIFIKHHIGFLWGIIDWGNGILFSWFFSSKLKRVLPVVFSEAPGGPLVFRELGSQDIRSLYDLIAAQPQADLKYFNPHKFDLASLEAQYKKPAFLMMGAFDGEKLAGYFFLRFFANKKCFVGRLIDKHYRGKGIGSTMNFIMYETAWRMGFRCLSTISRENSLVMQAHARNSNMVVVKELGKGYMLVEFVRKGLKA